MRPRWPCTTLPGVPISSRRRIKIRPTEGSAQGDPGPPHSRARVGRVLTRRPVANTRLPSPHWCSQAQTCQRVEVGRLATSLAGIPSLLGALAQLSSLHVAALVRLQAPRTEPRRSSDDVPLPTATTLPTSSVRFKGTAGPLLARHSDVGARRVAAHGHGGKRGHLCLHEILGDRHPRPLQHVSYLASDHLGFRKGIALYRRRCPSQL